MWFRFHNSVKCWGCAKGTHISFCIPAKSNIYELGRYTASRNFVSLIFWKRKHGQQSRLRLPALKKFSKGVVKCDTLLGIQTNPGRWHCPRDFRNLVITWFAPIFLFSTHFLVIQQPVNQTQGFYPVVRGVQSGFHGQNKFFIVVTDIPQGCKLSCPNLLTDHRFRHLNIFFVICRCSNEIYFRIANFANGNIVPRRSSSK